LELIAKLKTAVNLKSEEELELSDSGHPNVETPPEDKLDSAKENSSDWNPKCVRFVPRSTTTSGTASIKLKTPVSEEVEIPEGIDGLSNALRDTRKECKF